MEFAQRIINIGFPDHQNAFGNFKFQAIGQGTFRNKIFFQEADQIFIPELPGRQRALFSPLQPQSICLALCCRTAPTSSKVSSNAPPSFTARKKKLDHFTPKKMSENA